MLKTITMCHICGKYVAMKFVTSMYLRGIKTNGKLTKLWACSTCVKALQTPRGILDEFGDSPEI